MRRLVCILTAAIGLASVAAADALSPLQQLEQSKAAWANLRADCGGNYEYEVHFQSWVGFGHRTTIVVKEGKVVERRFVKITPHQATAVRIDPDGKETSVPPPPLEGWTEAGAQIGTHKDGAAAPKTVDTLYAEAAEVLQRKLAPHEKLYVAYHSDGVLRFCFYVDTRIADDAPRHGVKIDVLRLATPATTQPATTQRIKP